MLVVQRAFLAAADEGVVKHLVDMLDEMRERFVAHGSYTALD